VMANRFSGLLAAGLALGLAACGGESLTLPPSTGSLQVTTSTGGTEPDADGYTVQVDAQEAVAIGTSATTTIENLTPGSHSVLLAGMAQNCSVVGSNPVPVTIVAGEMATAAFALDCGGTTGTLEITAQTSGPSPDGDGYAISVDGSDRGEIGANATVSLSNMPAGSHVVGLTGVAANCSVQGDNLRPVTIVAGQASTLTFAVTCAQPPAQVGTLRITTVTSGADQDGNGYRYTVDGGDPQPIGLNDNADRANTEVGSHTVVLSDVAANCTVDDAEQGTVVTQGGTATVAFRITCISTGPTTGSIRVTTTTGGSNPDDGYLFSIDGGSDQPIGASGSQTVANVTPGTHTVVLSGVADNCSVNDASQGVPVTAGQTADVNFAITCSAAEPSASESEVTVSSDHVVTGQSAGITVRVKDRNGRRMAGVTVSVTASGSENQISPPSAVTGSNGVATFSFSSTFAEDKTITATANGITIDEKPVITVAPRSTTTQIVDVQPAAAVQGDNVTVTVKVAPTAGGGTPTGRILVFSAFSDPESVGCDIDLVADNGGQGSCTFVVNQPGTYHLNATYSGDHQFDGSSSDPNGREYIVAPRVSMNQAPIANDDPASGIASLYVTPGAGQPLTVSGTNGVLTNDTDPDAGALVTAIPSTGATAQNGSYTLRGDGGFDYIPPPPPFFGTDSFTYEASDGSLASSPATVTVTVAP
jgi:hypothetical protein